MAAAPASSPPGCAPVVPAAAVLVDIEGTTTSISFVKDVLFPYATENVEKFLQSSWEEDGVQKAVEGMRQQAEKDVEAKIEGAVPIPGKDTPKDELISAVSNSLKWLISIDNKNTHMKALSGFIWQKGYEAGELKGHLYEDVRPAVQRWKDSGRKVFIYSSGSVQAQKLLMKHSSAGDMEPLIDGYFDTNVGHKREAQSYKNILEKIDCKAEDTLFLTDIEEEGNAAKENNLNVILLSREGNAPISEEAKQKYIVISSFATLEVPANLKRKPEEEDEPLPPSKVAKIDVESQVIEEKATDTEKSEKMDTEEETSTTEKIQLEDENSTLKRDPIDETVKTEEVSKSKTEDAPTESSPAETEKIEPIEEKTEEAKSPVIEEVMETEPVANDRVPDIIETEGSPEENKIESDSDIVITDVTDVTETPGNESPELAEVLTDAQMACDNDIESEKLDELLGEKGVALEKECEEILSKVEQVTNLDLVNVKKPTGDILDDMPDELLLDADNSVVTLTDDVIDEVIPTEVTNGAKSADEIVQEGVVDKKVTDAEVIKERQSNVAEKVEKPESDNKERNGKSNGHELNGNGAHESNGNTEGGTNEKLNGETKTEDVEETNGVHSEEKTEIKAKKVAAEEVLPEPPAVEG